MAKRMIDSKAPGLAGMIKTLGATNFYEEDWESKFMDQLIRLYLVICGFKNINSLTHLLQNDLRNQVGITQNQDELKEHTGITDSWLVLGKKITEEDNLTVERIWLYGSRTNQYALVLQFSVRGQGTGVSFTPGMQIEAELVFFHSANPVRALVKDHFTPVTSSRPGGITNWLTVAEYETTSNMQLPFTSERPFIMEQIRPVQYAGQWWLADKENRLMLLKYSYPNLFSLLAISGGKALDMVVFGKENVYEPMGVWENEVYNII
ncbi:MAG: hypothetical protein WKI04_08730 [Ferruginibacter sp.]